MPIDTAEKLRIVNRALVLSGLSPSSSLSDGTDEMLLVDAVYEELVEAELSTGGYPWAMRTDPLVLTGNTPDEDWEYEYQLPAHLDIQAILYKKKPTSDWQQAEQVIWTDHASDVSARYSFRVGEGEWHPMFRTAVATAMQAAFMRGIVEDHVTAQRLEGQAEESFIKAGTHSQKPRRVNSRIVERRRYGTSVRHPQK